MGLSWNKSELIRDIQEVLTIHNVSAIHVDKAGTLFQMNKDGSLSIGTEARIEPVNENQISRLQVLRGGRE